jgi:SPX domain protein involved in polyphosphate accumulation
MVTKMEEKDMAEYQGVFKRIEKKYMLNEIQQQSLTQEIKTHMLKDAYGMHTISNIYYDTDSFELIRASIEKPVFKEKLRLRSYGIPKDDSTVFLELKKKFKGVVYKRRESLPFREAQDYLLNGIHPAKDGQILKEIDWFLQRYDLAPKAFIAYDRTAWFGIENPELRITFDQNIRFRDTVLDLSKGAWGTPLLQPHQTLMEIKIPGTMPVWLAHTLNELKIFPTSYSKYGTCYKEFLINEAYPTKGGIICA